MKVQTNTSRRIRRLERTRHYKNGTVASRRTYLWHITAQGMDLLPWAEMDDMPTSVNSIWIRSRARLRAICSKGDALHSVDRVEYKRCTLCGRIWLGLDAERLRLALELMQPQKVTCGAGCEAIRRERAKLRRAVLQAADLDADRVGE